MAGDERRSLRPTLAERRTITANRLFVGTPLLGWVSAVKWAIYPLLVRFMPRVAILIHEPESTRAFWDAIQPGMMVIDGGANRGGFSMLASRRAGSSGRVFAFEPEPENFAILRKALRRLSNVTVVQKAIAGATGNATLKLDSFHAGHSLTNAVATDRGVTVPVTTLDDFVADNALPGLDVVKFDIEGAELDAIRGMKRILSSTRRPVIICEVHPPLLPENLRDALEPYGYRTEMLDSVMTGAPHDVPVHIIARP